MASLLNALIGEYRIVESLGAGGMGEVYKAVHTHLGRVIAIKVLSPDLADGPALQRFYSEANIQASLSHPGVADYLGFYEYQNRPCILMEYVDGETLEEMIRRRGPLRVGEAVRILREVASVAAHFHALGVVHRDLKASNVKVNRAGQVKVLDFGIARHQRSDRLTRVGAVVGTPEALAPEQVRGEPVVPATDVWQLGVMFYELLTGQAPFRADTTHETFARILAAEFPPLARWQPSVPPGLDKVVARCLEKDPAKRFASAAELYDALCAWERGTAPKGAPSPSAAGKRAAILTGAVAATVLLIVGAVVAIRNWPPNPGPEPIVVTPAPPTPAPEPPPPLPPSETKSITVDTVNGVAHVFKDGKFLGTTPYQVQAQAGEKVSLILRREGCEDLPVQFEPSERRIYTFTLEPRKAR